MIYTIASTKLGIIGDPYLPAEASTWQRSLLAVSLLSNPHLNLKNLLKLVQNLTRRFNPHGYQHLPI
jgi:hypothetical protein